MLDGAMHCEVPYDPVSGHKPCTTGDGWLYVPDPCPVSSTSKPHSPTYPGELVGVMLCERFAVWGAAR